MNRLNLLSLAAVTVLTSACGGGGESTSIDSNGNTTSGGSLSGGTSSFPKTVSLSCKNTNTFKGEDKDSVYISESGATGSVKANCNSSQDFEVKSDISSLNITGAKVVDYWFCSNSKGTALNGYMYTHDLSKGNTSMVWSAGGKAYIKCSSSFSSPLPKTIASDDSIEELTDYWSDNNFDFQNCTYANSSAASTAVTCGEDVSDRWTFGMNATLTDSSGKQHKLSKKTTWVTTSH
ncbi:MAG: hypothetical protein V3V19_05470 [Cocleimonas sp.]